MFNISIRKSQTCVVTVLGTFIWHNRKEFSKNCNREKIKEKIDQESDNTTIHIIHMLTSILFHLHRGETFTRIRLGHTFATHQWAFKKSTLPICSYSLNYTVRRTCECRKRSHIQTLVFGTSYLINILKVFGEPSINKICFTSVKNKRKIQNGYDANVNIGWVYQRKEKIRKQKVGWPRNL